MRKSADCALRRFSSDCAGQIDTDGSGSISFMEFMRWWKGVTEGGHGRIDDAMLKEAKQTFRSLDDDGSGSLEK